MTPHRKNYMKQYNLAHKDRINAKERAWHNTRPLYNSVKLAKQRAKISGLPFDLDDQKLFQPVYCPVLGIKIDYDRSGTKKTARPNSPSLDRTVPARGYVQANVRVISHRANTIKQDATAEELEAVLTYVRRVA